MEPCMFCLEENNTVTLILNQYSSGSCECRIHTHVQCWMNYIAHKGTTICPICHTPLYIEPPQPIIQVHSTPQNEVHQYQFVILPPVTPTNTHVTSKRVAYAISVLSLGCILIWFIRF
jgi:hypothetical protein